LSILELARLIGGVLGWDGEYVFDPSMPDGVPRKLLDVSRLADMGWTARTALRDGIERPYRSFLEEHASCRRAATTPAAETRRPDGVIAHLLQDQVGAVPRGQDVLHEVDLVDAGPDVEGDLLCLLVGQP